MRDPIVLALGGFEMAPSREKSESQLTTSVGFTIDLKSASILLGEAEIVRHLESRPKSSTPRTSMTLGTGACKG